MALFLGTLSYVGHFEPCWHHIGLRLGHLGLFWGLCWSLFGDLDISLSLNFRPCKSFAKNTVKTRESNEFLCCVAWWSLLLFCFFLLGYAAHRLCLPDLGLILGILGHIGTILGSC